MTEEKLIDSLAIPKRQKVFDKTLLPAGDVLPVWENVSLDTKLPIPPSPRNCFILYTKKLGEPKYKSYQRYDFDLSNPRGREAPGPYDSLTDPSLKYYFNCPRTRQHLIESGLIAETGEVKCSIKEFNQYREFIRYRAATELALQKKREKRLEEENINMMFTVWPRAPRISKTERLRKTRSEPPYKDMEGLAMYKENLALKYRMKEKAKLAKKSNRNIEKKPFEKDNDSREDESEIKKVNDDENEKDNPVDETEKSIDAEKDSEDENGTGENEHESKQTDHRKDNNKAGHGNYASMPSSQRGTTLIHEMRQREEELRHRLEAQRQRRKEDLAKKVEESWHQRQQRQQILLQQEADIEAKVKEKRMHLIRDRERTLQQQRKKQERKLRKIKQNLFGANKEENGSKGGSEKEAGKDSSDKSHRS